METGKLTDHVAPKPGENIADYRARIAQDQAEALEKRQRELAEQTSDANTPSARIRIWERLHQIALPRNPAGKVLKTELPAALADFDYEKIRGRATNEVFLEAGVTDPIERQRLTSFKQRRYHRGLGRPVLPYSTGGHKHRTREASRERSGVST